MARRDRHCGCGRQIDRKNKTGRCRGCAATPVPDAMAPFIPTDEDIRVGTAEIRRENLQAMLDDNR